LPPTLALLPLTSVTVTVTGALSAADAASEQVLSGSTGLSGAGQAVSVLISGSAR
jgi:hypothetical protein